MEWHQLFTDMSSRCLVTDNISILKMCGGQEIPDNCNG